MRDSNSRGYVASRRTHRSPLPWMLTALMCATTIGRAQPEHSTTWGDARPRDDIAAATRRIYDTAGDPVFVLVRQNVLAIPNAVGCELVGTHSNAALSRIVASTWTGDGKMAVEFYFDHGALILAYESFEYMAEAAPSTAWLDARRLPGWERRSYFRNGSLVFAEKSGTDGPAPGTDGAALQARAAAAAALLEPRRAAAPH